MHSFDHAGAITILPRYVVPITAVHDSQVQLNISNMFVSTCQGNSNSIINLAT